MSNPLPGIGMDSNRSQFMARQRIENEINNELLTINDLRLTSKMLKLKQLTGELPKRFTPTQLKHSTKTQIKDALGATAGFGGSAYTGNVKTIALGLYEEAGE